MKIAWIYPVDKRCGISFYADAYVRALRSLVEVVVMDSGEIMGRMNACIRKADECDVVHVQYETSLFLKGRRDYYEEFVSHINQPVAVSLHEVYERFPGVYARDKIPGSGLFRFLREMMYDWRHPYVTAYNRHLSRSFAAKRILVHHQFQRRVLMDKGITPERLCVLEQPVADRFNAAADPWRDRSTINLCATGFINPTFDYQLLMGTLERLAVPWRFTWIGGLRTSEHRDTLEWITNAILERNWQSRFVITGWIDDSDRDRLLNESHVYLALFKQRSSSESFATAIGTRCCIVATAIPMVADIVSVFPVATVVERTPAIVARAVEQYVADAVLRARRRKACTEYAQAFGHAAMAMRMMSEYEEMIRT